MKNLILSGWGYHDYAAAAAVALRHFESINEKADVFGVSVQNLPDKLNSIPEKTYKQIFILGVGLSGNTTLLAEALTKLVENKVKVFWISYLDCPNYLGKEITDKMEIFSEGEVNLTYTVCKYFKFKIKMDKLLSQVCDEEIEEYRNLFNAAMYANRIHKDEKIYGKAIEYLAKATPPGKWNEPIVKEYLRFGNRELKGNSAVIKNLRERIKQVAEHDRAKVLITGESGTGKETIAWHIHTHSARKYGEFIAFNCASVTPNLLESRLLGYEKGAFTGANKIHKGVFEQANGGTLFLDEIGELPLEAQGILLRVLEEGKFYRIGDKEEVAVDVRLITATNRNLPEMVKSGKFREDLFFRLCVIQIHSPALREHKEDIGKIADSIFFEMTHTHLNTKQIADLSSYDYPGNVRELYNLIERAIVFKENDFAKLLCEHKKMMNNFYTPKQEELPDELEAAIKIHVKKVYEKYNYNLTHTAEALKAARNTVKKYLE